MSRRIIRTHDAPVVSASNSIMFEVSPYVMAVESPTSTQTLSVESSLIAMPSE